MSRCQAKTAILPEELIVHTNRDFILTRNRSSNQLLVLSEKCLKFCIFCLIVSFVLVYFPSAVS
jgi:hypothetical protein